MKNLHKLNPKVVLIALCVMLAYFSCKKDNGFIIDITGEPDRVIENVSGILCYNNAFKTWMVSYHIPGTIDSVEEYVIAEMPESKFPFEEGKQVTVSGYCYKIPKDIVVEKNKGMDFIAGTTHYYIKVTDLNYGNTDINFMNEYQKIDITKPDKIVENTTGTLFYNEYLNMWTISHYFSGTIDSVDIYLIAEMPDSEFPFEEGKQVTVDGLCYEIPMQTLVNKGVPILGGANMFFIKVTDLK